MVTKSVVAATKKVLGFLKPESSIGVSLLNGHMYIESFSNDKYPIIGRDDAFDIYNAFMNAFEETRTQMERTSMDYYEIDKDPLGDDIEQYWTHALYEGSRIAQKYVDKLFNEKGLEIIDKKRSVEDLAGDIYKVVEISLRQSPCKLSDIFHSVDTFYDFIKIDRACNTSGDDSSNRLLSKLDILYNDTIYKKISELYPDSNSDNAISSESSCGDD